MNIQLKNIVFKFDEWDEKDSRSFTARIFINDVRCGTVASKGTKEAPEYMANNEKGAALLKKAEAWVKRKPLIVRDIRIWNRQPQTIPIDLREYLYALFLKTDLENQLAKTQRNIRKDMTHCIVYGTPGTVDYHARLIDGSISIRDILKDQEKTAELKKIFLKEIKPDLNKNKSYRIFNTNIKPEILTSFGVRKNRIAPLDEWALKNVNKRVFGGYHRAFETASPLGYGRHF